MLYGFDTDLVTAAYNRRIHVLLCDLDGGSASDIFAHGIAVAPATVTTLRKAKELISQAQSDVAAEGDDWTYDEVRERLCQLGFDIVDPGLWLEERDADRG